MRGAGRYSAQQKPLHPPDGGKFTGSAYKQKEKQRQTQNNSHPEHSHGRVYGQAQRRLLGGHEVHHPLLGLVGDRVAVYVHARMCLSVGVRRAERRENLERAER